MHTVRPVVKLYLMAQVIGQSFNIVIQNLEDPGRISLGWIMLGSSIRHGLATVV